MKKNTINETVNKMRKIMGLNESLLDESEDVDLSKVDSPNSYTDDIFNYGSERGGDFGMEDDEEDSVKIIIPIFSALSDIQEKMPELRGNVNFIKALIQKMENNSVIATSELNSLHSKYTNQ